MSVHRLIAGSINGTPTTRPRLAAPATPAAEIRALVERRLRDDRPAHFRYLAKRLRSPEDAEDVLQEFALKAVRAAGRLTDPDRIDAWLGIALRNALFDRYRRNGARTRLTGALEAEPRYNDPDGTDDDTNRALHCLAWAFGHLPPEAARLLQRAELEETPLTTIAVEMKLTANTVGVRAYRARAELRRRMQTRCQTCPDPCSLSAATAPHATPTALQRPRLRS